MDDVKIVLQKFLDKETAKNSIPAIFEEKNIYPWLFERIDNRPKEGGLLPNLPDIYLKPARIPYELWKDRQQDVCMRGLHFIPAPYSISLFEYLSLLENEVVYKNETRVNWLKSLRNFCTFLRKSYIQLKDQGHLECIFPQKMEFVPDHSFIKTLAGIKQRDETKILRIPDETAIPIDIVATSEIVQNLIKIIFYGRPNSQQSAAEALGLMSICLAVASNALMTREEILYELSVSSLSKSKSHQSYLHIPTYFGKMEIPISIHLYEFLLALPRKSSQNHIFNMRWGSLLRTLKKAVQASDRTKDLGRITFLTFMVCFSHHAIGQRSLNPRKKKV